MVKHINETIAAKCRYGDNACEAFKDSLIIFEESLDDWQGYANILGVLPDGRYFHYEWSYGSCSGCDEWEAQGYSSEEINQIMINGANYFDLDSLRKYLRLDEEFCKEMKYPCINSVTNGSVPGMVRQLTNNYSENFIKMAEVFNEYYKTKDKI